MPARIYVIISSTRPTRIGRQIAEWVVRNIPPSRTFDLELLDLKDWRLPILDEPSIPATGLYTHEHTRAWSRKIAAADGYIFVTPQYNWGYPASQKNALDHLFNEWNGKPAVIVSYGYHGGGKAAAQLRQVLEGLRMRPTKTMPAVTFSDEMLTADGHLRNPQEDFSSSAESVLRAVEELVALLVSPPG
jgi:NAD(P)H-dependent FMN reductase